MQVALKLGISNVSAILGWECTAWLKANQKTRSPPLSENLNYSVLFGELRPVYTGDFCRSNSMQIFVALKLQLQNRKCKPGAIFSAICRRDIAGVSNMFET